uniref:Uncharacterized protein n=1 Tax=Arundo donax TaxID=35708 RepID=A0A0A9C165_ARUDO
MLWPPFLHRLSSALALLPRSPGRIPCGVPATTPQRP